MPYTRYGDIINALIEEEYEFLGTAAVVKISINGVDYRIRHKEGAWVSERVSDVRKWRRVYRRLLVSRERRPVNSVLDAENQGKIGNRFQADVPPLREKNSILVTDARSRDRGEVMYSQTELQLQTNMRETPGFSAEVESYGDDMEQVLTGASHAWNGSTEMLSEGQLRYHHPFRPDNNEAGEALLGASQAGNGAAREQVGCRHPLPEQPIKLSVMRVDFQSMRASVRTPSPLEVITSRMSLLVGNIEIFGIQHACATPVPVCDDRGNNAREGHGILGRRFELKGSLFTMQARHSPQHLPIFSTFNVSRLNCQHLSRGSPPGMHWLGCQRFGDKDVSLWG